VLNRRRQIIELFSAESWLRSRSGRVLSGAISAITAPQIANAARNGERLGDHQDRKNDDSANKRDLSEENNQSKTESDERTAEKDSAEPRDSAGKSDNAGKHVRDEGTNANSGGREQRASDSGKSRGDSGRTDDSGSDSKNNSTDDDGSHHGVRHVLGFEQKATGPTVDSPPNTMPHATFVTPANPNVVIDAAPDTSINDLVVQGNDQVIASVSTSGGFAFARSGDVIAVSGPDGASIIQSGDVNAGTSGTSPTAPSDAGGNNDVGFSS
jgi:hypothetical protein